MTSGLITLLIVFVILAIPYKGYSSSKKKKKKSNKTDNSVVNYETLGTFTD